MNKTATQFQIQLSSTARAARLPAVAALALALLGAAAGALARDHASAAAAPMTEPIRVNSADAETLRKLHGVGKKVAQRIIRRRERLGAFEKLEELIEVRGISRRLIDRNRKRISLE